MAFLDQFFALSPYCIATLVSTVVAVVLLRDHGEVPGRTYFGVLMAAVALWSLFNFLEDASTDWSQKWVLNTAQYVFIASVPVLFFRFACRYTLDGEPRWVEDLSFRVSLWILPVAVMILVWFDPALNLIRTDIHLESLGPLTHIGKGWAPGFWVFAAYCYALIILAVGLWFWDTWKKRGLEGYRGEAIINLATVFLPWGANVLQVVGLSPWVGHDLTTPAFSLMGVVLLVSIGRNRFLSLIPVARETLFHAWSDPVLVFDRKGRLVYFNRHAQEAWSLSRGDLGLRRGQVATVLDWLPAREPPEAKTLSSSQDHRTGAVWQIEEQPMHSGRRIRGTIVTCHDVTRLEAKVEERSLALEDAYLRLSDELQHRRRTEQQLFYYSLHDPLTGLGNRSFFLSRLGQELERCKRTPTATFGVLMLDLVGFKKINDQLGHALGDEFLFQTALRLGKAVRSVDTAARSFADTFLVLLDSVESPELLKEAAERIRMDVEAPLVLHGATLLPNVQIGLVWGTADDASPEAILGDAEIALAKTSDPSARCVLFDPRWRQTQRERNLLKDELGMAVVRGDLHLIFQPIVSLETGRLMGFEALSRWTHPTRGLIPPNLFIPLAEQEGTIRPLGLWVLREAARIFATLCREYPALDQGFIAVNVSPIQLAEPDFAPILLGLMSRENLSPSRLHLEITETALVENAETLIPVLKALRAHGIGIKLDDFGTGYSSLHALHRLPVNSIKIDRSFVVELPQGEAIIRTIVSLATELNLDVVAEGVETLQQYEHLRRLGCGSGQGFLFSRGWTIEELWELYRDTPQGPAFPDDPQGRRAPRKGTP